MKHDFLPVTSERKLKTILINYKIGKNGTILAEPSALLNITFTEYDTSDYSEL